MGGERGRGRGEREREGEKERGRERGREERRGVEEGREGGKETGNSMDDHFHKNACTHVIATNIAYKRMYVCMSACIQTYLCMYVCMHTNVSMYVCLHPGVFVLSAIPPFMYAHARVCILYTLHVCMHTHTFEKVTSFTPESAAIETPAHTKKNATPPSQI